MENEKEIHFEEVFVDCIIKEEPEDPDETTTPQIFNSTTDYILNKPLKPLPDALQKILPSLFSVKIKNESIQKNLKKEEVISQTFSCSGSLPLRNCKFCKFSTTLKIDLDKHIKTAHKPIEGVLKRPLMKIHQFKEPRKYNCLNCNFSTHSKLILLKHVSRRKKYHLLEEIESKYFHCQRCDYTCSSHVDLRSHLWDIHSMKCNDYKLFKCEHCYYFNEGKRNLRRHLIREHRYREGKFYHCDGCVFKYFNADLFLTPSDEFVNEKNQFLSATCDCQNDVSSRPARRILLEKEFRTLSFYKI